MACDGRGIFFQPRASDMHPRPAFQDLLAMVLGPGSRSWFQGEASCASEWRLIYALQLNCQLGTLGKVYAHRLYTYEIVCKGVNKSFLVFLTGS